MRLRYLLFIAALGTSGYFYFQKDPPPPPEVVKIDPQKIKNRREVIRFYERAIADLEETMGYRSTVNVGSNSAESYDNSASVTRSGSANSASSKAHRKQIEEYKRRIAAMKAEIGET